MAERHLWDAVPQYALVVWPDATDPTLPDCIKLAGVADAVAFGAVVIAREDEEFCKPRQPVPRLRLELPDDNGANEPDE